MGEEWWTPAHPDVDVDGIERAWRLVEARGAAAQLCVVRGGDVLLDRSTGCARDSLFWLFSASKPFVAMLVHLLAQRGALSLDDTVAAHWPEFGQAGKETVTIRQVLQHRSGMSVAGNTLGEALSVPNWDRSVRRIERARPAWAAGEASAYQYISYGFILGELVQRVTGRKVRDVMASELLEPLGLGDTFLGLPDDAWRRHVPIHVASPAGRPVQVVINRRATRRAVIPAAGVSTTAWDLARFYLMLLRGGEVDGVRVLDPAVVERARTPSSDGEVDRFVKQPIRSLGRGSPRQAMQRAVQEPVRRAESGPWLVNPPPSRGAAAPSGGGADNAADLQTVAARLHLAPDSPRVASSSRPGLAVRQVASEVRCDACPDAQSARGDGMQITEVSGTRGTLVGAMASRAEGFGL